MNGFIVQWYEKPDISSEFSSNSSSSNLAVVVRIGASCDTQSIHTPQLIPTGVDKGGAQGAQAPPNGRAKKNFFVKIEGLSS